MEPPNYTAYRHNHYQFLKETSKASSVSQHSLDTMFRQKRIIRQLFQIWNNYFYHTDLHLTIDIARFYEVITPATVLHPDWLVQRRLNTSSKLVPPAVFPGPFRV